MKALPIRAQDLLDQMILTVEQFEQLQLSRMPKKVRVRVKGEAGAMIQVQHVAERIHMSLLTEYRLPPVNKTDAATALTKVADAALQAAGELLDADRWRAPRSYSIINGRITIHISDWCTGEQALDVLTNAERSLVACADDLLSGLATGICRKALCDPYW